MGLRIEELAEYVEKNMTGVCIDDVVRNKTMLKEGQVFGASVGGQDSSPWKACPKEIWSDPAGYVGVTVATREGGQHEFWLMSDIKRVRISAFNVVLAVCQLLEDAGAVDFERLYIMNSGELRYEQDVW